MGEWDDTAPLNGAELLIEAAVLMHGSEFIDPFFAGQITVSCCRCGRLLGPGSPDQSTAWSSFQTLVLDGKAAGFAFLWHCTDCQPAQLLPEIRAKGTWPRLTDNWRFAQGELRPDGK